MLSIEKKFIHLTTDPRSIKEQNLKQTCLSRTVYTPVQPDVDLPANQPFRSIGLQLPNNHQDPKISLQNIFQNDDALELGCCQTIKQQVAQAVARPHIGPACSSEMLGLFEWRLQTRHASGKDGKVQQNGQQLLLDSLLLEAGKCMAYPSSLIV